MSDWVGDGKDLPKGPLVTSPAEGFAEAKRRIAACRQTRETILDLGGLQLRALPDEIFGVTWITHLYLGGDAAVRKTPYFRYHYHGQKRCNAFGALPDALFDALAQLEVLDLAFNDLPSLPRSIARLSNLISLDLSRNQIGDVSPLAGLTGLTSLDLSRNQISDVSPLAGLTGLTSLDLGSNQIDDVSPLVGLTDLTSLDLGFNEIGDVSLLRVLDRLEEIDLSGCDLRHAVPDFWRKPSLREVHMEGSTLGDVPPELLGHDCLPILRAFFDALDRGTPVELRDVKVMILGNGQIGKTQMRRRLCGEAYDDSVRTTHGIQIADTELVLTSPAENIVLKIWDFGGKDIYLGTHALFLRSRAIVPILWTPESEDNEEHVVEGYVSRNYPLDYWLRYIRQMGGDRSLVLLVQAQCDVPELRRDSPVDPALRQAFVFPPAIIHYSAKTDLGQATLEDALGQAVGFLRRQQAAIWIGAGWAAVKTTLETWRREDQAREGAARQYRTLTLDAFFNLCRTTGGIESEEEARVLLRYLHDLGTVFYDDDLFDQRIILDQQWALDAIYAVFDQQTGLYKAIELKNGRFLRSQLDAWLWRDKFAQSEQVALIKMMQACDICFLLREESEAFGEALYVAPDLLPRRADFHDDRSDPWPEDDSILTARYRFDLLPSGLIRSLMAKVGQRVGQQALYWREGFYFEDDETGASARVEASLDDPRRWTGMIQIQTRDGVASNLSDTLCRMVDDACRRMGIEPAEIEIPPVDTSAKEFREALGREWRVTAAPSRRVFTSPVVHDNCFISYAQGNERNPNCPMRQAIEQVLARLEAIGLAPVYDKQKLDDGSCISEFMKRAAKSPKAIVILSEKYLRSSFCMFELTELYRHYRSDMQEFRTHVRIIALPDATILTYKDWLYWQDYWDDALDEMDTYLNGRKQSRTPRAVQTSLHHMREFAYLTGDLLAAVADTLHYRSIAEIEKLRF